MNIKKFIYKKSKIFNLCKIFGDYAFQPFFLLIHLTLDCNCNCQYCYQKNNSFYTSHNDFIKPVDFENILIQANKYFLIKPKLHFFGGEPMLNPYFDKLLNLTQIYKMDVSMTTNGILLDQYLNQISKSNLNQINISIDGLEQEHDRIKGIKDCFQNVISNINKLRNKEKKRKKIININTLITSKNYKNMVDFALYFKNNNIDIDVLVFQHIYFNQKDYNLKINLNILKSQIKELKDLKTNFDILLIPEIKFDDLINYYMFNKNDIFKNNCNIPWLGLNILPDLKITPGGGVLGCNCVIGDFKKENLKEVWNNSLIKNFRECIIKNGLPDICFRCCHRQYY